MQRNFKEVWAVYNDDVIRVYQAYSASIANEVIKLGKFGSKFKTERMTWIKPSFLWMMYRSGWASKQGQERILAIDISIEAFNFLLENAVASTYKNSLNITNDEWKNMIKTSEIRFQWDPERDIYGNPLNYRSLQIGIKGNTVKKYINDWIKSIEDITPYVIELRESKIKGNNINSLLPKEKIYKITPKAVSNLIY